jgi:hypothetical protein
VTEDNSALPRIARRDDVAALDVSEVLDLSAAVLAVLSTPAPEPGRLDALAVPVGQGEDWRLQHTIRLWESNPGVRRLLVANGNPAERTYVNPSIDQLRALGLRRLTDVHVQRTAAPNTALQSAWIAENVDDLGIRSLGLVVSPYHLPRNYLTVLQAVLSRGTRIPIFPIQVPLAPHSRIPETGATSYELWPGEVQRMVRYSANGWIASPAVLRGYLEWLWTHGSKLSATH